MVRLGQSLGRKRFGCPNLGEVVGQVGRAWGSTGIQSGTAQGCASFRLFRFGHGSSPEGASTGNQTREISLVTGVFLGGYGD